MNSNPIWKVVAVGCAFFVVAAEVASELDHPVNVFQPPRFAAEELARQNPHTHAKIPIEKSTFRGGVPISTTTTRSSSAMLISNGLIVVG
jgi:hypothetical protein